MTILEQFQSFGFLQPARENQSASCVVAEPLSWHPYSERGQHDKNRESPSFGKTCGIVFQWVAEERRSEAERPSPIGSRLSVSFNVIRVSSAIQVDAIIGTCK